MYRLGITDYAVLQATPEPVLVYGLAIRDEVAKMRAALERAQGSKS